MDLLVELENMAINADTDNIKHQADIATVKQWKELFGYNHNEAIQKIELQRSEQVASLAVPAELWEFARSEMERHGYDREAYEHLLIIGKQRKSCSRHVPTTKKNVSYLIKLGGPLSQPEEVGIAAGLQTTPELLTGVKLQDDEHILGRIEDNEDSEKVSFCRVTDIAKAAIHNWLSRIGSTYQPIFIQLTQAEKDLCSHTIAPFLGLDPTLPQFRASSSDEFLVPAQSQYPVWYFFYGMLAESGYLPWILELPKGVEPQYQRARVRGGKLVTWGGKYRAMIDAPRADSEAWVVDGKAFLVQNEEEESKLRFFETYQYEVVRCNIEFMESRDTIRGLTFRFIGPED
jgi:hypothetical protein